MKVQSIFLAIHAFGMRCFKVLDEVGVHDNLSLTSIALMMNSFRSDKGAGSVWENIFGNTCIWAEMFQSVRLGGST